MPTLYVLQGSDKGKTIDVTYSPCLLGRGSEDVPLTDNTISRRHAELVKKKNDTWVIHDLNSANGTYVNGVKVSKFLELKQGDQIRCGASLLVFGGVRSSGIAGQLGGLKIDEEGNIIESSIMATVPSLDDSVIIAGPETSNAVGNLRLLYELSTAINSIFDRQQLLEKVMDMIFDNLPADRGFILIRENDDEEAKPVVVRYRSQDETGEIMVSHTIVDHVLQNKEGVICSNAMRDPRFAKGKSVQNYAIRSALCVPITVRDKIMGVISVDTTVATHTYAGEQLRLLTAIGFQTGLALEHARLYQAGVQAERLAAAGETIAYLSHGIKNILQSLQSAADMVEMGLSKNKISMAQKGWAIMQRNLTKIQNLVLNMLAFSKVRQPHLVLTQLNHLISESLEMLTNHADEKQIALISDLDDHLPAIAIDPDGIQQVVLNLILNALDAVEETRGVITVKTSYDSNSQLAILSVSDNGMGIEANQLSGIFRAFQSSKGHGGTGLGLAVVQRIVEEHHGSVSVESTPREGTTFIIKLPGGIAESEGTSTAAPPSRKKGLSL
ncbi:MAG: FHA domain-containing protein [Sedimentisphaerales bacterium]|nr:FHA domain-containing protein [Sedimentisphaerales bacterium]